jgi:hypothetical protein
LADVEPLASLERDPEPDPVSEPDPAPVPDPVRDPVPELEDASPDDPPPSFPSPPESVAAAAFVREPLELERSFLAHPEPLKCTAGGTKTFLSVPSAPHAGQKRGAGASIPWMTSVRVEQLVQR